MLVHTTWKMSRNFYQRSYGWLLIKVSRHNLLFRKEGVSLLTQVFVYSADTVSWTTDSCRCRCSLHTPHACCYQQLAHIPRLSVLDKCLVCDIFVLKQQTSSRKTKKTIWKRPMGTLFMESLKRLEADMATKTRNPLSLLQLTMRFLSFLSNIFFTKLWHHRYMLFGLHETAHPSAQDGDSSETIWLWIACHPEAETEKWGEQLYQSAKTMNTVGFKFLHGLAFCMAPLQ